jgi:hypothetical protein
MAPTKMAFNIMAISVRILSSTRTLCIRTLSIMGLLTALSIPVSIAVSVIMLTVATLIVVSFHCNAECIKLNVVMRIVKAPMRLLV